MVHIVALCQLPLISKSDLVLIENLEKKNKLLLGQAAPIRSAHKCACISVASRDKPYNMFKNNLIDLLNCCGIHDQKPPNVNFVDTIREKSMKNSLVVDSATTFSSLFTKSAKKVRKDTMAL